MKGLLTGIVLLMLAAQVQAGELRPASDDGTFNFDQPFEEAINKHVLRSLLNRALDALEDHLEVNGRWRSGNQAGDPSGRFEFKLYPKGKSRSDEHVGAEGTFRFSPEKGDAELNFRFKSAKPSSHSTTSDPSDFL